MKLFWTQYGSEKYRKTEDNGNTHYSRKVYALNLCL